MRQITTQPQDVPPVNVAPALTLAPGHIFVSADNVGTCDLPAGRKVVLATTAGGPLELLTSKTSPPVTAPGTYLDASDLGKLGDARTNPTVRAYGFKDTWRKIRTKAGVILAIGAVATAATAIVGLVLALTAASSPPSVDVAKVRSVLGWARVPLDQLKTNPTPTASTLDASRRTVDAQITTAEDCLVTLQGGQAPPATIPGVTCTPPATSGWSAQTVGGVTTAVIALLTATLGFLSLASKYGFQESPS